MTRSFFKPLALAVFSAATLFFSCSHTSKPEPEQDDFPARLPGSEGIPIMAWHGVDRKYMSADRFKEAAGLGVTLNYSRTLSLNESLMMLDCAKAAGIKCFIEIGNDRYGPKRRAEVVAELKNHPALAGYFCMDEPLPEQFGEVAQVMKEVQAVDKDHPCYCNLLPSFYADWTAARYEDYVETYLSTVPVGFLSFDQYPVVTDGSGYVLQPSWYRTLEITSRKAREHSVPLWAFMLTVEHDAYPKPTLGHLRLQGYSNLAYGAQVLQLFTYWSPSADSPAYKDAPIKGDGTKSGVYDVVKEYLAEVQRLAYLFHGASVEYVRHLAGEGSVPEGTTPLKTVPEGMESVRLIEKGNLLVSVLSNHGYKFMILQNTSPSRELGLEIKMKPFTRRVLKDGTITAVSSEKETLFLSAGDVLIYMWK